MTTLAVIFAVVAVATISQARPDTSLPVIPAKPPSKIVGGTQATLGEFPYLVSLNINGNHFCGGTIIDKKYVVTAAHCIIGQTTRPYSNLLIRAGSLNPVSGGQTYKAKTVVYHGYYQQGSAQSPNDLALIELEKDIQFNGNVRSISIASAPTTSRIPAQAAGWGFRSANSGILSKELYKVDLTTIEINTCAAYIPGQLYTHQVCAVGPAGKGICQGDSGGPLIANGQLIGVVSYNIPCAQGYPDVYTSVYHYADWIKGIMDGSIVPQ